MSSELQTRMRTWRTMRPRTCPVGPVERGRTPPASPAARGRRSPSRSWSLSSSVPGRSSGRRTPHRNRPPYQPEELHLPRTVYAPSPWAEGTDELGPPGPLAVLAGGERKVRDGLTGSRSYPSYYGVSAVDGSARFLDLPLGGAPARSARPARSCCRRTAARWPTRAPRWTPTARGWSSTDGRSTTLSPGRRSRCRTPIPDGSAAARPSRSRSPGTRGTS